ncbi:MAG TPA: glutaredoxin family protein [Dehalococcoidia bacterium]|nr:glutaredoxin family protein [Dehalococcoidia bacterium]
MTSENNGDGAASGQSWPKVTMYTTSWCPDCRASKRFLNQNGVPFTEFDVEAQPETAEIVRHINNGMQKVPTIVIEGGPTLVEPSDRELGKALGVG